MSPVKSEAVVNRPLTAAELSSILRRDFDALLARDGILSATHIAFGRVSYEIRVTLHLANPAYPTHEAKSRSKRFPKDEVSAAPQLAAVEPDLPLKPDLKPVLCKECGMDHDAHQPNDVYVDPDNPGLMHDWNPDVEIAAVHAVERSRDIPSPNLARIQHGMPITIETRGLDNRVEQKEVIYPKEIAEGEGPQPVDADVSEAARKELGV